MSDDYRWEGLHCAVHVLCGDEDRKDRLRNAISSCLNQIEPENDLPGSMREEFASFMNGMTPDTLEQMEGATLGAAIETIVGFYDTICRHRVWPQVADSRYSERHSESAARGEVERSTAGGNPAVEANP